MTNEVLENMMTRRTIRRFSNEQVREEELRDSRQLSRYIRQRITDDGMWYVLLDEVQMCKGFESVLNGLNRKENLDIYVTGSNSKFLSSDMLTEFRGVEIMLWRY